MTMISFQLHDNSILLLESRWIGSSALSKPKVRRCNSLLGLADSQYGYDLPKDLRANWSATCCSCFYTASEPTKLKHVRLCCEGVAALHKNAEQSKVYICAALVTNQCTAQAIVQCVNAG
jgi:hypothetical protein